MTDYSKLTDNKLCHMLETGHQVVQMGLPPALTEAGNKELVAIEAELVKRGFTIEREQHGDHYHININDNTPYDQHIAKMSLPELKKEISEVYISLTLNPNDEEAKGDMDLLIAALKKQGVEAVMGQVQTPLGIMNGLTFKTIDLKAKSDALSIDIPSVDALINGPIAPDLPKHGYLNK